MTLREIAEMIPLGIDEYHQADWSKAIVTLLNAVVEERAKYLMLHHRHYDKSEDHFLATHFFDKALRELNLKGVWPGKEGE